MSQNPLTTHRWQIELQEENRTDRQYFNLILRFRRGGELYNTLTPKRLRSRIRRFAAEHQGQWLSPEEMPGWLIEAMAPAAYDGLRRGMILLDSRRKEALQVTRVGTTVDVKVISPSGETRSLTAAEVHRLQWYTSGQPEK